MTENNNDTSWSYIISGLKRNREFLQTYNDEEHHQKELEMSQLISSIESKNLIETENEKTILDNWPNLRSLIKPLPYVIFNAIDFGAKSIFQKKANYDKILKMWIKIFTIPLLGLINILSAIPLCLVRSRFSNVVKETSVWILNSQCCLFTYFLFDTLYNWKKLNLFWSGLLISLASSILFLISVYFAKKLLSKFKIGQKILSFCRYVIILLINR